MFGNRLSSLMPDRFAAGWSAVITGGPNCFLVIIFGESMKVLVGVKRVVDAYVRVRVKQMEPVLIWPIPRWRSILS